MLARAVAVSSRRVTSALRPQLAACTRTQPVFAGHQRWMATKFAESHEYLMDDGRVGITRYAANALGEAVYVELPEVGEDFEAGERFGSVESVKAASDVYAPVDCTVTEINEALTEDPSVIHAEMDDNKAWFIKVEAKSSGDNLLDEAAYEKHCEKAS